MIKIIREDNDFFDLLEKARKHWAYNAEGYKLGVSDLITAKMLETGMSVQDLSNKTEFSFKMIDRILKGYENLTLEDLAKIGKAINYKFITK